MPGVGGQTGAAPGFLAASRRGGSIGPMTHPTTAAWRAAGEALDLDAAVATLADDVVLRSPLTERVRFEGRAEVADILRAAFATVEDIAYHTELGDDTTRALFYTARVGDQPVEEAQLIRLDADQRISEVTFWLRPLPGTVAVMEGIGAALTRRRGGERAARSLRRKLRPLIAMVGIADRQGAKTAKPR